MKDTRSVLAGIIAEYWCYEPVKRAFGIVELFHDPGSIYDTKMKEDYWCSDPEDYKFDVKASDQWPNCLIEKEHPAFSEGNLKAG